MKADKIYNLDKVNILEHIDMSHVSVMLVERVEHKYMRYTINTFSTYSIEVHECTGSDEFGDIIKCKYYEGFTSKTKAIKAFKAFKAFKY